jgi:hypothetical protein
VSGLNYVRTHSGEWTSLLFSPTLSWAHNCTLQLKLKNDLSPGECLLCVHYRSAIGWRGERCNSLKWLVTIRKACIFIVWFLKINLFWPINNSPPVCTSVEKKAIWGHAFIASLAPQRLKPQNRGIYFSLAVIASSLVDLFCELLRLLLNNSHRVLDYHAFRFIRLFTGEF